MKPESLFGRRLGFHDENGIVDLLTIGVIAIAIILVVAFLFGGILAAIGSLILIVGLVILATGHIALGMIFAGIGLVMDIVAMALGGGIL